MAKDKYPVTPAIRQLREHQISFEQYLFAYETHGGAEQAASELNVPLNQVIKTIVFTGDDKKGLIVLMHGDKEISTKNLARQIGMKHIEPASATQAHKWTGYQFGGTSPFGIRTVLPIYVEKTIYDLPFFWINGGKQGFQVRLVPEDLAILSRQ